MSRFVLLLLAALCVAGASAQAVYPTLGAAVIKSQPNDYKIFAAVVAAANLTAALELNDVTIVIPSDEAFNKTLTALNVSAADILASAELPNILLYHMVPAGVAFTSQAELIAARSLTTVNGQELKINATSTGAVIIGGLTNANVTGFSGLLGNSTRRAAGSFFTIDFVLVPLPVISGSTNSSVPPPSRLAGLSRPPPPPNNTASAPSQATTRCRSTSSCGGSPSSSSTPSTAGIIVGAVVSALVLVAAALLVMKRRRKQQAAALGFGKQDSAIMVVTDPAIQAGAPGGGQPPAAGFAPAVVAMLPADPLPQHMMPRLPAEAAQQPMYRLPG